MTTEEWRSKSDDFRAGWRACNEGTDIPETKSEEWVAGYRYALEHPFGAVAIPM